MPRTALRRSGRAFSTPTWWWAPVPKWKIAASVTRCASSHAIRWTSQGHSSSRRSQESSQMFSRASVLMRVRTSGIAIRVGAGPRQGASLAKKSVVAQRRPAEGTTSVNLTISTWNINSVRLRIDQVKRFLKARRPDVLCLQETKCPNDKFPLKELQSFGYPFVVHMGQKGYNGVAILSRYPFSDTSVMEMCGRSDARHITVTLSPQAKAASGLVIHNFYVPAGGDIPDPGLNEKFRHKLQFMEELRAWGGRARPTASPAVLVGDLNVAPLEHDVWSHKQLLDVVSHTPVETAALEE